LEHVDGAVDHPGRQLTIQADKTAAVNPMKELRIEKLVISQSTRCVALELGLTHRHLRR
jgi:hypothetical protein